VIAGRAAICRTLLNVAAAKRGGGRDAGRLSSLRPGGPAQ